MDLPGMPSCTPVCETLKRTAYIERRREREFYKYFEPLRALSGADPTFCDVTSPVAIEQHVPKSSPDKALTAFCQLGALRLKARRALLFFFDTNYGYILAESTRSLSLQDDAKHAPEDNLWLGFSSIPRGQACCETTVQLPPCPVLEHGSRGPAPVYIVNDLQADPVYGARTWVTSTLHARFYAGVPVVTPKGVNIGAYCILDDQPRDTFSDKDTDFLHEMAGTVMDHLEMVRSKAAQLRGTEMVKSLGSFVQDCSDLRDGRHHEDSPSGRTGAATAAPPVRRSGLTQDRQSLRPKGHTYRDSPAAIANTGSVDLGSPDHWSSTSQPMASRLQSSNERVQHGRSALSGPPISEIEPLTVESTFQRAAESLRQATRVDGVAFLDASIGTFGGLVDAYEEPGQQTSDSALSYNSADEAASDAVLQSRRSSLADAASPKACSVLAWSSDTHGKENFSLPGKMITENFLKSLLRRFPYGKIWTFDEDGAEISGDSSASEPIEPITLDGGQHSQKRRKKKRRPRKSDWQRIQQYFPGVRCFALHGLWDFAKGRWLAGCFIWTTSPMRILSTDADMNYVAAFCDVTCAEIQRLEVQRRDRSKSDFVSSISHELRSPLHGILGNVELLQEQSLDQVNSSLVSQIETCGRTLLDIIDHLLDFSHINNLTTVAGKNEPEKLRSRLRILEDESAVSQMGNMISLDVDVSLDEVTEEVVESSIMSFHARGERKNVVTIFEVEKSDVTDWRCRIPLGAWKRLCMNLVTNALKYTDEGHIIVRLKAEPSKSSQHYFDAVFLIADSGKGMSRDFLTNSLFKAFAQEDHVADGIGLGMNLVAKIVKAFGGSIDVTSDQLGSGTRVKVQVPLARGSCAPGSGVERRATEAYERFHGRTVGLFAGNLASLEELKGPSSREDMAHALQFGAIAQLCHQLGLRTQLSDGLAVGTAELEIVAEKDLERYLEASSRTHAVKYEDGPSNSSDPGPIVIVCNSSRSELRLRRARPSALGNRPTAFVVQPCGPLRLAAAINSIAGSRAVLSNATTPRAEIDIAFPLDTVSQKMLDDSSTVDSAEDATIASEIAIKRLLDPDPAHEALQEHAPQPRHHHAQRTLPVYSSNNQPLERSKIVTTESSVHATAGVSANSLDFTILLVDDNNVNLKLLVTFCQKNKLPNITAADGLRAVEAYTAAHDTSRRSGNPTACRVRVERPRVVLMDINMPNMDGFEATRQIRTYEQQNGLQPAVVVALTGLGSAQAQREAYSSGINLFLTKPVRLKELSKLLQGIRGWDAEPGSANGS